MKYLQKIFFSMGSAAVMVMLFAIAIGAATFIENDYGPTAARVLIYEAKWFEIILMILGINLVGNIVRYKLWLKGKRPILVFHIALFIIYLGAALTRYAGYEGVMRIREGANSNHILSKDPSLTVTVNDGSRQFTRKKPLLLTPLTRRRISEHLEVNGREITVSVKQYIPDASRKLVEDTDYGVPMVVLSVFQHRGSQEIILRENESKDLMNTVFAFVTERGIGVNRIEIEETVRGQDTLLTVRTGRQVIRSSMIDRTTRTFRAGIPVDLERGMIYAVNGTRFALRDYQRRGHVQAVETGPNSSGSGFDAVVVEVNSGGVSRDVSLFGGAGVTGEPVNLRFEDIDLGLSYGSTAIPLPFSLTLVDFEVDRYPGSMKPSSFSSDVIIMDDAIGMKEPFKIYMNHILRHRGYRFFQSEFDPDERGTILSVSHDPGTLVAYAGFILMMIGMVINLFQRDSRFRKLGRKLNEAPAFWVIIIFLAAGSLFAQNPARRIESLCSGQNKAHIDAFARLLVQDVSGRIKPVSSLAHEFAYNLTGSPHMPGAHPVNVVLSMWMKPDAWKDVPLFRIDNPVIREGLGIGNRKYAALSEMYLKSSGAYRLGPALQTATQRMPGNRNKQDREILKLDERVKAVESILDGSQFRFYPLPVNNSKRWTHAEDRRFRRAGEDSIMVAGLMSGYREAVSTGRWEEADMALLAIEMYQSTYGGDIIPGNSAINAEVLYNNWHLLERLAPVMFILGLAVLVLTLLPVFRKGLDFSLVFKIIIAVILVLFVLQTAAFILRWIAAQHAPWSNKYESMIYIAWATLLAGLLFSRRSMLALGAAAFWNGLILLIAHMAWMDPHITNLAPVLKSYWLVIHVSVITSSYGFLGLAAVISSVILFLFIFKDKTNEKLMEPLIRTNTWLNERILTVGLTLIVIGNIFGAVWANESWGRYWGWDPKETWTLIVILVYTAVIHLRLIPGMRRVYLFHVAALLALSTVLMTYFGVNFYLSGLHSYAAGDPVPVPWFVYADLLAIGLVIVLGLKNSKLSFENVKKQVKN